LQARSRRGTGVGVAEVIPHPILAACAVVAFASAATASPVPIVEHSRLVGITGLSGSGCAEENCAPYVMTGTIVSVDRQAKTELPTGFRLRRAGGEHHETIEADWQGASLIDVRRIHRYLVPGQAVMVIGTYGLGREPIASEILSLVYVRKIVSDALAPWDKAPSR
jgi:hypothetical protein